MQRYGAASIGALRAGYHRQSARAGQAWSTDHCSPSNKRDRKEGAGPIENAPPERGEVWERRPCEASRLTYLDRQAPSIERRKACHFVHIPRIMWSLQHPISSRPAGFAVRRVHPVDKHVGARVRMRRLMVNKIQAEVANALGVTFQQLQKYENGANRISASRLQLLCAILQVPVSFFFEGLPDVPETDGESAALNGFLATSDGIALMTGYARIRDPKVRRAIVALVEQIVAEPVSEPGGTVH
jgi:transcriptional regulator with XRE-family HTH domain